MNIQCVLEPIQVLGQMKTATKPTSLSPHWNEVAFFSVDSSFQPLSTVSFDKERRTGARFALKTYHLPLKVFSSKMTAKQIYKISVLEGCGEKY